MIGGHPLRYRALVGLSVVALGLGCAARAQEVGGVEVARGSTSKELAVDQVARRGAAAVAVVTTDVSRGLAFVVDPAGYLITSRHVIEDCDHIESVTFPGLSPARTFASVQVVYIDPNRDLALLRLDAGGPLPSLPLGTDGADPVETYLRAADRVLLLARSEDSEAAFVAHAGRVNDLQVFNPGLGGGAFVGLTNDVRQGQSGGPVLDRYGRAVGVVTWTWRHRIGGYAIPIDEATRMLRERPSLDSVDEQSARAQARALKFVDSVYAGDLDQARRMLSPTYARSIRTRTIDAIFAKATTDGQEAVAFFFAALEELIAGLDDGRDGLSADGFREMVLRTGSREFRDSLGVGDTVASDQVVSFFFELGKAYMGARYYGHEEPEDAIGTAIERLRSLDAARTFAFAELSTRLGDEPSDITEVEIVPGVYSPQALVTLHSRAGRGKMVMQMRMEWGDWYVAQVQDVGE